MHTQKTETLPEDPHPYGEDDAYNPKHFKTKYVDREERERIAKLRLKRPEEFCFEGMFDVRPASEWTELPADEDAWNARPQRAPEQLLGPLWREGEVAVLFGETGIGKSVFAMQIAESIARGAPLHEFQKPTKQPVAYFDLAMSHAAFAARYSYQSSRMKKAATYRFPQDLARIAFNGKASVPHEFQGDRQRYYLHSISLAFRESEARVLVIDDLVRYAPDAQTRAGALKAMRSLRFVAEANGMSVLIVSNWPARSANRSPVAVSRSGPESVVADLADSVFCLARTTFGPDTVYLKHLKSNSQVRPDPDEVQILRVQRAKNFSEIADSEQRIAENGKQAEEDAASTDAPPSSSSELSGISSRLSSSSPLSVINSQLSSRSTPYLGFHHLGVATEEDATTDYRGEIAQLFRRQRIRALAARGLKASQIERLVGKDRPQLSTASDALHDGIMDGRYKRYLLGP